jgi:UDP-glucose 4-epimerase
MRSLRVLSAGKHISAGEKRARGINDSCKRRRYLVTGGCGFIGSHLVDALLQLGHAVRILDNLSTGHARNKPEEAQLLIGDVLDTNAVCEAMEGVDGCFHLAAIASVERSNADWLGTHRVNVTGTVTVLETARRIGKTNPIPVIYASSAAVYGAGLGRPLDESVMTIPLSAYGAGKLGSELHARVARQVHGVPAIGLRFFNVFGPRQDPSSPYSGVISIFCRRLAKGDAVVVFGDGTQKRDFVFVRDVTAAMLAAMHRQPANPSVFNVCTGEATSILTLARTIAEICGVPAHIDYRAARAGDIHTSLGDPSAAREVLGFVARTSLRDGLEMTLAEEGRDHARAQRQRPQYARPA